MEKGLYVRGRFGSPSDILLHALDALKAGVPEVHIGLQNCGWCFQPLPQEFESLEMIFIGKGRIVFHLCPECYFYLKPFMEKELGHILDSEPWRYNIIEE